MRDMRKGRVGEEGGWVVGAVRVVGVVVQHI